MPSITQCFTCLTVGGLIAMPVQSALARPTPEPPVLQMAQSTETVQAQFARHFQDLGIEGSILIYDLNQNRMYQHNPKRNATPFLPASTYKILNSLIALETGVIVNDLAILTWDGIERMIPAWNRDLNMRVAFSQSAV